MLRANKIKTRLSEKLRGQLENQDDIKKKDFHCRKPEFKKGEEREWGKGIDCQMQKVGEEAEFEKKMDLSR